MSNEILVDNPQEVEADKSTDPSNELVSWIIEETTRWRDYRNNLPEVKR